MTFNYEQHAINCCEDHCGDFAEMIISRVTGKHPPDFNGRQLVVTRAPEPSDINWQHLRRRESNWEIVRIAIGAKLVLACALVIGGIIQYFFEVLRSNELENITNEVAFQSTASTSSYIRLQLVASSTSLMVVIINFLLDRLTVYLAQVEVYKTKTIETNMLIATLTFVNLLNYVIVPIVTNRCSSAADGVCNWYVPGGFIEYAFYLQVFNVLLLPFRNMNIDHLIKVKMLAPMAKTLSMQESLLRPPAFAAGAVVRRVAQDYRFVGNLRTGASRELRHKRLWALCAVLVQKVPRFVSHHGAAETPRGRLRHHDHCSSDQLAANSFWLSCVLSL